MGDGRSQLMSSRVKTTMAYFLDPTAPMLQCSRSSTVVLCGTIILTSSPALLGQSDSCDPRWEAWNRTPENTVAGQGVLYNSNNDE